MAKEEEKEKTKKSNEMIASHTVWHELDYGKDLLERRKTIVPNFKNYKNIKYFRSIRPYYKEIDFLGKGQFGEVVKVKMVATDKEYAMKKMAKKELRSRQMRELLLSELQVL